MKYLWQNHFTKGILVYKITKSTYNLVFRNYKGVECEIILNSLVSQVGEEASRAILDVELGAVHHQSRSISLYSSSKELHLYRLSDSLDSKVSLSLVALLGTGYLL